MHDPFAEPADTREAILGAAFRALCDHGYADLTISRIGEQFEKSPSLVYHHYDGKDELLLDLLEFLLDGFESSISGDNFDLSPRERIDVYVTAMLNPDAVDRSYAADSAFLSAIVELRAQAATDEAYRDHFDRSDQVFTAFLNAAVQEAAVDCQRSTPVAAPGRPEAPSEDPEEYSEGPVDPAEVAATLQTLTTGGMLRWATTSDRGWVTPTRDGIQRYVALTLPRVVTEDRSAPDSD